MKKQPFYLVVYCSPFILFKEKDGAYTKDKQHHRWKGKSNHESLAKQVIIQLQCKIVAGMLQQGWQATFSLIVMIFLLMKL